MYSQSFCSGIYDQAGQDGGRAREARGGFPESALSRSPSCTFSPSSKAMSRPTAADHLSHFLRTTATPLGADKVWMLLEYSLEASSVALLSRRVGSKGRRKQLGEQMQKLGRAISTARVL